MTKTYSKILSILETLDRDRILVHLNGNCLLAADVVQNMLSAHGVHARIIECQLMITHTDPAGTKSVHMVGYELGVPGANQVDTHAVTVTQDDCPLLVDVSVGHLLENPRHVIVAELVEDADEPDGIACAQAGRYELVYRKKRNIR